MTTSAPTRTTAGNLNHLLATTQGLTANSQRDDYGRTYWDYTMGAKVATGEYRRDHLVVVNLPKSYTEKYGHKFMVNTAPARFNQGEVVYFVNRAEAHLFAVKTLLARWEAETPKA